MTRTDTSMKTLDKTKLPKHLKGTEWETAQEWYKAGRVDAYEKGFRDGIKKEHESKEGYVELLKVASDRLKEVRQDTLKEVLEELKGMRVNTSLKEAKKIKKGFFGLSRENIEKLSFHIIGESRNITLDQLSQIIKEKMDAQKA